MPTFKALVIHDQDGEFVRQIEDKNTNDLPEGDVLIRVHYSSLNYKDALSATGNKGVTRNYPHTPGIDAAGEVVESADESWKPGDQVLVTGYDLGMNTAGGFGQYIRVPKHWVVKLPNGLTLKESMTYGTAGFTAALSVHHLLESGIKTDQGPILVPGATGGVGSLAVGILAQEGLEVTAATGKTSETDYLKNLGAQNVVTRSDITDDSNRPILTARWAGVVDTVGGDILATALKTTQYGGTVTCCGLVASPELQTTVFPFILRGLRLIGIDSVLCPMDLRQDIWNKIATKWKLPTLNGITTDRSLEEVSDQIDHILNGQIRGRVVVSLSN
ncbi:MAG: YhdH/YhfP family quinone oxidoreductase [Candidatus Latescibacteria bacterium]|nr:YhdH/YhfP family quinone oxidoreductase [Candidatus Latescibacterota bacterium]